MDYSKIISGSKTRLQMAMEYGISYETFRRRLRKYRIALPKGLIYPKWQAIIYVALGMPPDVA